MRASHKRTAAVGFVDPLHVALPISSGGVGLLR